MTRTFAMFLRGSFRLMLAFGVAVSVAWSLLWLIEAALKSQGWWYDRVWLVFGAALVPALTGGIVAAIACDRASMRVGALRPGFDVKRWQ